MPVRNATQANSNDSTAVFSFTSIARNTSPKPASGQSWFALTHTDGTTEFARSVRR